MFADNAKRQGADHVICGDYKETLAKLQPQADDYYVCMTRGHRFDMECLTEIFTKSYAYVGMMGSKKRAVIVKKDLEESGFSQEIISGLHSPIGLAIGGQTPEEIALSVISEIVKCKNERTSCTQIDNEVLDALTEVAGHCASVTHSPDEKYILCTIIKKNGSAPRGVGTQMLVSSDNRIVGTIGGGCAEALVISRCRRLFRNHNILFTSTEANENNRPQLIVTNKISLASPIQSLSFEFVCLNGNGEASYMTDWKNSSYAQSISFTGCAIQNIKRTLVRISDGSGVFMTDITIDNCVISEVGTDGYGMINFGKNIDQLEKVSITNSTLINIGDQLMDVKGGIGDVILENCTFYNSMDAKKELPKVFRFDNAASTPPSPKSATMRNLIFSGPNKGKKMNSGNGAYDILNFSDNCYITSDLQEGNNRFEEITRIKQSSDDLFVDPLNGDFHIKPGVLSHPTRQSAVNHLAKPQEPETSLSVFFFFLTFVFSYYNVFLCLYITNYILF